MSRGSGAAAGRGGFPAITVGALIGLVLGLAAGALIRSGADPRLIAFASGVGGAGTLWTNALRALVLPLVITNLVVAIARMQDARTVSRMGGLAVLIFAALLAAGAVFTLLAAPPMLARFSPSAAMMEALHAAPRAASEAAQGAAPANWWTGFIPVNLARAAADDDILAVVLFTVLFAVAMTRIGAGPRHTLLAFFEAAFEAVLVMLKWVLRLSPAGVFALALDLALHTGVASAGVFGYWVAMVSALMLAFTLLLYPLTALTGRVSMRAFARAALGAQTVALGTRSSLAALPALLEDAEHRLGLPSEVAGFAIPLAVSTFKVNRTLSSVAKLMFLAKLYGIHPDAAHLATFSLMVGILSFATPGIPSAGTLASMPAYLAAGIPIEGVVLLNAVDAIPDIFKTVLNVTSDLSAAAILNRLLGNPAPRAVTARAAEAPAG